jgi:nucleoside phosphorylase
MTASLSRRRFLNVGLVSGVALAGGAVCGLTLLPMETFDDLELRRYTVKLATRFAPPTLALPEGLFPRVIQTSATPNDPLPKADVLICTYTVAEGEALADILTPGLTSAQWIPYQNNWAALNQLIESARAPSLHYQRAGIWALIGIGDVTAVVLKSDLHPATDGPKLPIAAAWQQWVAQVQPKLVISTGTAGAVQDSTQLGDVVVSGHVSWDCRKQFKNKPFAGKAYASTYPIAGSVFAQAEPFLAQTAAGLPAELLTLNRKPVIWLDGHDRRPAHVISTDFFAFDDAENSYGLRSFDPHARVVEMDDAAMADAIAGTGIPWVIIRNASDPQMPAQATVQEEAKAAGKIYEKWGQVTSWGSAITCWAAIAALSHHA